MRTIGARIQGDKDGPHKVVGTQATLNFDNVTHFVEMYDDELCEDFTRVHFVGGGSIDIKDDPAGLDGKLAYMDKLEYEEKRDLADRARPD